MIATLCARYLERRGHVLIPPGTGRAVINGYVVFDAGMDLKVVPSEARVLQQGERAVPASARVLPPGYAAKRERAPDVGTTHTPMRAPGEPRTVVGIMGGELTYRTATTERTVKVSSFNDWRRDVGAVESRG